MTRVSPMRSGEAGLLARLAFRASRQRLGSVPEPVAVTARHPAILAGYGAFEMALERSSLVDERLKELAGVKAAMVAGCEFCLDIGSALARRSGVTEAQLRALASDAESEEFTELERLVLDYAEGMSATPVAVSDELVSRLRERLGEPGLVELTAVIAFENYRARFNWALGIESGGFSEGAYCPAPTRPQPRRAT